jgi:phosphonate transport system substrate-binding protein
LIGAPASPSDWATRKAPPATSCPATTPSDANGINPTRDFKATRLATHEANILAVANGQIDACATSSETLERLLERQPALRPRLREVWRSPLIPSDPLVVKTSLPEATRAAVQAFFVAYGSTAEGLGGAETVTWSTFQVSSDTQLHPLRILRLQRERALVEADSSLAPAAREQRLAALAARIEALAGEDR